MSAPSENTRRRKQQVRDTLLTNELRSFNSRGFHDGYDDGKKSSSQQNFDLGYKKAFEQQFILSTLKGVAEALKSSCNLNNKGDSNHNDKLRQHNNSTIISCSSSQTNTINSNGFNHDDKINNSTTTCPKQQIEGILTTPKKMTPIKNLSRNDVNTPRNLSVNSNANNIINNNTSNLNNSNCIDRNQTSFNNQKGFVDANLSSNHLNLLESMKFDDATDIENLKDNLIKICRDNRLEILAHYVAQIG